MPHGKAEQPLTPKEMPTMLHVDMEEIEGLPDVEIGDKIDLKVSVEVTGIAQDAYEDTDTTKIDLKVGKIEFVDRTSGQETEPKEEE